MTLLLLEKMSISVNGESKVPPGFRFHPTEEELLLYYLRKKVSFQQIDLDVIQDVDLNKLEPWDIQEKCKIGSTPQNDWYFFSHKDKKYPTGTRTNRATISGFWKATGRDKVIYSNSNKIGMRKTLVFYIGRAPHGLKSDWIMHEYRLHDNERQTNSSHTSYMVPDAVGEGTQEESWVVCRVFRKKNLYKSLEDDNVVNAAISTPEETRITEMLNEGSFETTNYKEQNSGIILPFTIPIDNISNKLMQLPTSECPNYSCQSIHLLQTEMMNNQNMASSGYSNLGSDLDRLVASHSHLIEGVQNEVPMAMHELPYFHDSNNLIGSYNYPTPTSTAHHDHVQMQQQQLRSSSTSTQTQYHCPQDYTSQFDLWSIDPSL